jgi:hypothetical protein
MHGHECRKTENARRHLVRVAWNDQIVERDFLGVTLSGEAKRDAPAQAELRPTCAERRRLLASPMFKYYNYTYYYFL